jgi:opacity protein-like surface antigen
MAIKVLTFSLLLTASAAALAQTAPASAAPGDPAITPVKGQSQDQLARDRYECYVWAKQQSGFDPALSGNRGGAVDYRRAFTACMTGRGYQVNYGTSPGTSPGTPQGGVSPTSPSAVPPPPPGQPVLVRQYRWQYPELTYRPFHFAIEGGATVAAGSTGDDLDDGGNIGLGVSWFPSESLPVGLRFDGSWSRFDARYAYFDASGESYTHSHENIYGGDLDLQFNLPRSSARYQFYLLGGAGWYREQQVIDQFQPGCGYYYCGPGFSGRHTSTTGWRSSWNAGVGAEWALPQGTSFFVEARYQRIAPHDSDMQFVPIRVGLRF